MALSKKECLVMYRKMQQIRHFENKAGELYLRGRIWGAVHLYTGEEAVAVGVCMSLNPSDYITSTHRGHGHCIAKGGNLKRMMAEIYGKETGYCKGKGGSMHIADVDIGILGANAIVGDGIGIAVGAALASKLKGESKIAVAFFGEGATSTGIFHEAVNLAAVLELPVVFICENNQYAVSTHVSMSCPVEDVGQRAQAYGITSLIVDGSDVEAIYAAASEAVKRARQGAGPTLVEAKTYRWEGHYKGDPETYRTDEEVDEWRENKDPIKLFGERLIENKIASKEELSDIEIRVAEEIDQAVQFAEESPAPSLENLFMDIYA